MPHDALAAARALLPAWVVWAPLGSLLLQAFVSALLAALAIALTVRPLRRLAPDAHWSERARLVFRVRCTLVISCVLSTAAGGPLLASTPLGRPGPLVTVLLTPLVALVATLAVAFRFEDRHVRRLRRGSRWRSAAGWAVLVFPAYLAASAFASWAARWQLPVTATLVTAAGVVLLASGAAPWIGRALGLARPPSARARAALSSASRAVGLPEVQLLTFPIASANALAFQLTRTVGVTEGALAALDDAELAAILAHELGHLLEPVSVQVLRALVVASLPVMLVVAPWALRLELLGWSMTLLLVCGLLLLYQRLQRALERRADDVGQAASPVYAAALEKLGAYNLSPATRRRAGSHPDLYDRLLAAGGTPAWPRPAPPPGRRLATAVLLLTALAILAGGWQLRTMARTADLDDQHALAFAVALDGDAASLGRLAFSTVARDRQTEALTLFTAAEALDGREPAWPAWRAYLLTLQHRCAEARLAAERASALAPGVQESERARQAAAHCSGAGEAVGTGP